MNNDISIGIVGLGFVGSAIKESFEEHFKVFTYDNKKECDCETLAHLVTYADIIFVCVPTPMIKKSGECYTGIVEDVCAKIDFLSETQYIPTHSNENALDDNLEKVRPIVVIKSTITPGATARLAGKYDNIDIIFNPEFLTEANAMEDFKNQTRTILGCSSGEVPSFDVPTNKVQMVYEKVFPDIEIFTTDSTTAEMVKYLTNTFLAVKVSYANEMYAICNKLEIDYDKVIRLATQDKRLGTSHWLVPGPDREFGYGGHCFPKDLSGLLFLAQRIGVIPRILIASHNANEATRENKDWMSMTNRAVIDDDDVS